MLPNTDSAVDSKTLQKIAVRLQEKNSPDALAIEVMGTIVLRLDIIERKLDLLLNDNDLEYDLKMVLGEAQDYGFQGPIPQDGD